MRQWEASENSHLLEMKNSKYHAKDTPDYVWCTHVFCRRIRGFVNQIAYTPSSGRLTAPYTWGYMLSRLRR
jgi:hypothetical protein